MALMLMVTVLSVVLAVTMAVVAWRVVREDRRRSDARIAALAADIHTAPSENPVADMVLNERPHVAVDHLFDRQGTDANPSRPRLFAVLGGGALVFACVAVLVVLVTSAARPTASANAAAARTAMAPAASGAPLELVALAHEREDDRLTVRGTIRNPAGGREVTNLTAVVLLFNQQGGFLTSGRATIDGALEPGAEAPFAITVPGAADVGRYRVSFRTDDRVIPHVDRRS